MDQSGPTFVEIQQRMQKLEEMVSAQMTILNSKVEACMTDVDALTGRISHMEASTDKMIGQSIPRSLSNSSRNQDENGSSVTSMESQIPAGLAGDVLQLKHDVYTLTGRVTHMEASTDKMIGRLRRRSNSSINQELDTSEGSNQILKTLRDEVKSLGSKVAAGGNQSSTTLSTGNAPVELADAYSQLKKDLDAVTGRVIHMEASTDKMIGRLRRKFNPSVLVGGNQLSTTSSIGKAPAELPEAYAQLKKDLNSLKEELRLSKSESLKSTAQDERKTPRVPLQPDIVQLAATAASVGPPSPRIDLRSQIYSGTVMPGINWQTPISTYPNLKTRPHTVSVIPSTAPSPAPRTQTVLAPTQSFTYR